MLDILPPPLLFWIGYAFVFLGFLAEGLFRRTGVMVALMLGGALCYMLVLVLAL